MAFKVFSRSTVRSALTNANLFKTGTVHISAVDFVVLYMHKTFDNIFIIITMFIISKQLSFLHLRFLFYLMYVRNLRSFVRLIFFCLLFYSWCWFLKHQFCSYLTVGLSNRPTWIASDYRFLRKWRTTFLTRRHNKCETSVHLSK